MQTQIEQTKAGLESNGIEVEFVRWWDAKQRGDLIHFFSIARSEYLKLARERHLPVVMTPLLSATCNRPRWKLALQAIVVRTALRIRFFQASKAQLTWTSFPAADHLTVGLKAEEQVLLDVFNVDPRRVSVVPLGISQTFLTASPSKRNGPHLITTGTIYTVKGTIALAEMARAAKVPVLFVGKPYNVHDPYWLQFQKLIDNQWVKYQSHVESESDMVSLLQGARGFVLNSQFENWSLSASEAVACGLPVLLRDKNWSRERFGEEARYLGAKQTEGDVRTLRQFYDDCPGLPAPKVKLFTWKEVAMRLTPIYDSVLSASR